MNTGATFKDYIFYNSGAATAGFKFTWTATLAGSSVVNVDYRVNNDVFIDAVSEAWNDVSETGWLILRVRISLTDDGAGNSPILTSFNIESRNCDGYVGDAVEFSDDVGGEFASMSYSFAPSDNWTVQAYFRITETMQDNILFSFHDADDDMCRVYKNGASTTQIDMDTFIAGTSVGLVAGTPATLSDFETDTVLVTVVKTPSLIKVYMGSEEVISISTYAIMDDIATLYIGVQ